MSRSTYELSEVIRRFLPRLPRSRLSVYHRQTLETIRDCRTAVMGGHIDACDSCGNIRVSYNSCRNRHCPKCQGLRKEMWIVKQEDMLLPVAYYHIVFTLPHELNGLCLYNPKLMYDLLFKSAWHALKKLSKDENLLGAQTAATMILHTWSQTLGLHPHVHCIVPDGGLNQRGEWIYPKKGKGKANFLFPVKSMQKIFKGKFLYDLKRGLARNELRLPPDFPEGYELRKWKDNLYGKDWVVYTKKPFSGVKSVVAYLGRYSHRVALTNRRIKEITQTQVTFEYKDYKDRARKKLMTLTGEEFLSRFSLHILPKGFRKVRQFGFLSNAVRKARLAKARLFFGEKARSLLTRKECRQVAAERLFGKKADVCPCCQKGKMISIGIWKRNKSPPAMLHILTT